MTLNTPAISGSHKTQLISDSIHAFVVLSVVAAVTILAALQIGLPPDVIGTVYGGAIGYAAGRAGNIARSPLLVANNGAAGPTVSNMGDTHDE